MVSPSFSGYSGFSVKKDSPQRHGVRRVGEFFNQELFTPRPESVLSDVEGRLRGALFESCFTGKPEAPFSKVVAVKGESREINIFSSLANFDSLQNG